MNGFQQLVMNHYFPQGPRMGGTQPPQQGYNGSGINPGGMYTGGNLPGQMGM